MLFSMQPNVKNAAKLKGKTGVSRLLNACRYSYAGFLAVFRSEQAFRQECYVALILIPVASLLPIAPLLRVLCIVSLLGVLLVELLNSALEAVVDRIGHDIHPLSKLAKDAGSAAVSLALLISAMIWLHALGSLL